MTKLKKAQTILRWSISILMLLIIILPYAYIYDPGSGEWRLAYSYNDEDTLFFYIPFGVIWILEFAKLKPSIRTSISIVGTLMALFIFVAGCYMCLWMFMPIPDSQPILGIAFLTPLLGGLYLLLRIISYRLLRFARKDLS